MIVSAAGDFGLEYKSPVHRNPLLRWRQHVRENSFLKVRDRGVRSIINQCLGIRDGINEHLVHTTIKRIFGRSVAVTSGLFGNMGKRVFTRNSCTKLCRGAYTKSVCRTVLTYGLYRVTKRFERFNRILYLSLERTTTILIPQYRFQKKKNSDMLHSAVCHYEYFRTYIINTLLYEFVLWNSRLYIRIRVNETTYVYARGKCMRELPCRPFVNHGAPLRNVF